MPKTDEKKEARKDEAAKTKRTKAEVTEAAVARLREKLAKAEERAAAAKITGTKKQAKLEERTRKTLALAFDLAEKAGVVLAAVPHHEADVWGNPQVLRRDLTEEEDGEGRLCFLLHTTGETLTADEDEAPGATDES